MAAPPALEFESNPPGGSDLISGSHAATPISEQNTVPDSLPDWLDSSLNIRPP